MTKQQDYAALSQELDSLLEKLQSEDMQVDEALSLYERGMEITKQLEKHLKHAENTVQKIKATLKD